MGIMIGDSEESSWTEFFACLERWTSEMLI